MLTREQTSSAGGGGRVIPQVQAACRQALEDIGFRKRAGLVYTREVTSGVLGWVGLNTAVNPPRGPYEINPVIGVRHQAVEHVVAELSGQQPHAYVPPTLSSPLGYLLPESRYRAWSFDADTLVEASAVSLATGVREAGLPFIAAHSTLEPLLEALSSAPRGVDDPRTLRLCVALQLADQRERAEAVLDEMLLGLGNRTDAASTYYRDFGTAFRARFGG